MSALDFRRRHGMAWPGMARLGTAGLGKVWRGLAGERLILLLDCQPPAHAFIDRCGWTFWFCHGCKDIDHFERPLSREQLDRYTRGHRLFCAEDADATGAQHV